MIVGGICLKNCITVEMVVSLSHKTADSHININVKFGGGDGKIPVDDSWKS